MFEKFKTILKGKDKAAPAPEAKALARPEQKAPQPPKVAPGKPAPAPAAAPAKKKQQTPEEICGITPKMSKDEIHERLAFLYKRYNRATSSLDAGLRSEAEEVLDAVVIVREKVFGPI